jgi:FMN phosphatase YigB (HAD superfamily)
MIILNPSIVERLKDIRVIIWDFDDTLYKRPPGDMESAHAILRVLRQQGVDQAVLSNETFYKLYERDYNNGRLDEFIAREFGLPYAKMQLLTAQAHDLSTIIPFEGLVESFAASPVKNLINTHACRPWIERNLMHLSFNEIFAPEDIICHVEHGEEKKSISERTHRACLKRAGFEPHQALMVDDRAENLIVSHRMGMGGVLMAPNFSGSVAPYVISGGGASSHVDIIIQNPIELHNAINDNQSPRLRMPLRPGIAGAARRLDHR